MEGAGKDGTALYNKHHPWVNAAFVLKGMAVGRLDEKAMMRDGLTSNTLGF